MKDNLPPRKYAEQVLGKAVSSDQLDELFELHAAAHPVVTHGRGVMEIPRVGNRIRDWTDVSILGTNPNTPTGPSPGTIASGLSICNDDAGDQHSKRLGVTIAFGRALVGLRLRVTGGRQDKAAVH